MSYYRGNTRRRGYRRERPLYNEDDNDEQHYGDHSHPRRGQGHMYGNRDDYNNADKHNHGRQSHGHHYGKRGQGYGKREDKNYERRGGHRYYNNSDDAHSSRGNVNFDGEVQSDKSYMSRPPGLRGKEIGMFYAKRSRGKKLMAELNNRPEVSLQGKEAHIKHLLSSIDDSKDSQHEPGASTPDREEDSWDSLELESISTSSRIARTNLDQDLTRVDSVDSVLGINAEENEEMETNESEYDDEQMFVDMVTKKTRIQYQEMANFREKLPSYKVREEIRNVINSNQVTVISGETGCGKTTQVPQFILDEFITRQQGSKCHIICTQPRRISAISVAQRVADERAEPCGEGRSVGYSIRLERNLPRSRGSILFCTTGILLKKLESDPKLKQASHIIVDEIHERDLQTDFLLIILKNLLSERPDLKVILMSATLNADQFSKYFGNCPLLNIPGFTFPVKEYNLEDVLEMTKYVPPFKESFQSSRKLGYQSEMEWNLDVWCRNLEGYSPQTIKSLKNMNHDVIDNNMIFSLIKFIVNKMEDGAILVFVPGWADISALHKTLQKDPAFGSNKYKIIPLHSRMPTINQKDVFQRPPPGVRKIVIATNIAETSVTIDDVVYVIDTGKIKLKDFNATQNIKLLESQWVSKANARQRRGRAGRVQPGHCFRLYTKLHEEYFKDYQPAEMLRTRLEDLCLRIKLLKLGKIKPFVSQAMEMPSLEAIDKSIQHLLDLQALDEDENLTPLGYHLARMPVDPLSGKLILYGAMFGCLDPITTVAASLSFKTAFVIPLGKEEEVDQVKLKYAEGIQSDHYVLIKAYWGWEDAKSSGNEYSYCRANFLSQNTLKMLKEMKQQFSDILHDIGFLPSNNPDDEKANVNSDNWPLVKAVICAGLYPNVAKIGKVSRSKYALTRLNTKCGKKAVIHPASVNFKEKNFVSDWFVYHQLMQTTQLYVYDMTEVSPYALLFFGGKISQDQQLHNGIMRDAVVVDDWARFWCPAETAVLVKKLRKQLDSLLEKKINNTGLTNWNTTTEEGKIMNAIRDLLSTEGNNML